MNKKAVLYTGAFLLSGCINAQNIPSENKTEAGTLPNTTCSIPADAFNQLPSEVLVGTDVVDISSFKPTDMSGIRFHTEMGGSSLEIYTQALAKNQKIQRIYKEPDLENINVTYSDLCLKAGYLYGESVRGIFTKKGILWLELKSGHEFISSDLWIYLEKQ